VRAGAPGFWSPTQPLADVLGQFFCLPPILLWLPVSTWVCPATGAQQAWCWQVRPVDWTDVLSSERWQSRAEASREQDPMAGSLSDLTEGLTAVLATQHPMWTQLRSRWDACFVRGLHRFVLVAGDGKSLGSLVPFQS